MDDPRPPERPVAGDEATARETEFHPADEFFGSYPALSVLSLGLLWILGYQLGIWFFDSTLGNVYLSIILSAGFFHVLNPYLLLRRHRAPLLESLRVGVPSAGQIVWLSLLTLCLIPTLNLLTEFNTRMVPVPADFEEFLAEITPSSPLGWVLAILAIVVVAPIGEEIVFRGCMQQAARTGIGPLRASVGIGIFFGLIHLQPFHLIPLAFFGIALGLVFERTGNLLASIWMHALHNASSVFLSTKYGELELDIPRPLVAATAAISLGLAALAYSQLRNAQPWTLDRDDGSGGP